MHTNFSPFFVMPSPCLPIYSRQASMLEEQKTSAPISSRNRSVVELLTCDFQVNESKLWSGPQSHSRRPYRASCAAAAIASRSSGRRSTVASKKRRIPARFFSVPICPACERFVAAPPNEIRENCPPADRSGDLDTNHNADHLAWSEQSDSNDSKAAKNHRRQG